MSSCRASPLAAGRPVCISALRAENVNRLLTTGLASLLYCGAVFADDVSGSDSLLCYGLSATRCELGEACETVEPWQLNLPDFVKLDLRGKRIQTTAASAEQRETPLQSVQREQRHDSDSGLARGARVQLAHFRDERRGNAQRRRAWAGASRCSRCAPPSTSCSVQRDVMRYSVMRKASKAGSSCRVGPGRQLGDGAKRVVFAGSRRLPQQQPGRRSDRQGRRRMPRAGRAKTPGSIRPIRWRAFKSNRLHRPADAPAGGGAVRGAAKAGDHRRSRRRGPQRVRGRRRSHRSGSRSQAAPSPASASATASASPNPSGRSGTHGNVHESVLGMHASAQLRGLLARYAANRPLDCAPSSV